MSHKTKQTLLYGAHIYIYIRSTCHTKRNKLSRTELIYIYIYIYIYIRSTCHTKRNKLSRTGLDRATRRRSHSFDRSDEGHVCVTTAEGASSVRPSSPRLTQNSRPTNTHDSRAARDRRRRRARCSRTSCSRTCPSLSAATRPPRWSPARGGGAETRSVVQATRRPFSRARRR